MKVNIFDLKFEPEMVDEFAQGCREILETGFLSENRYTKEFEERFAKLSNAKHGIAVTSGTAALELALKAVDVEGKGVIIPSNTFFATATAVRNAGGCLQLVDMEDETFSICPEALKKAITPLTKAVIIVHIGGIISKHIDEILKICNENGIILIEDAAHAQGSRRGPLLEQHTAGSIGHIGCFSFFPTKVMTTGEGGMLTTNSDDLADKLRSLKNFGRDLKDIGICVRDFGNNYKVSEFTSLMGCLEMGRVMGRIERRRYLTKLYKENLPSFDVFYDENIFNTYYKAIVKTDKPSDVYRAKCKENGVSLTGEVYKIPVHRQPLWQHLYDPKAFPITSHFSKHHICPPLYPELTDEQVLYTCKVLEEV